MTPTDLAGKISGKHRTYRIAGSDMDANLVKSRFMQIGLSHVQYVLTCLDQNTTKVTNIKQYFQQRREDIG